MHESKKDLNDYIDCHLDRKLPSRFDASRDDAAREVTASKYIHEICCHGELPPELYDDVRALICRYASFGAVRHGQDVIVDDRAVSWHFNNDYLDGKVTVCFYDGHEWQDDAYLDEVPHAFLIHILNRISKCRCPRDEQPDKILGAIEEAAIPKIQLSFVPSKYRQTNGDSRS